MPENPHTDHAHRILEALIAGNHVDTNSAEAVEKAFQKAHDISLGFFAFVPEKEASKKSSTKLK